MTALAPIHREILVDGDPDRAFEVFTAGIGRWWPLADGFGVHGDGTVAFRDGTIVETSAAGDEEIWGSVLAWEPPSRVAFTWHPGRDAATAGRVSVEFARAGSRTLVSLAHDGWEVYADPEKSREEYGHGWPIVLAQFRDACDTPATWAALMHTPGPGAPTGSSIFADPRFGEHAAFLERMRTAGYLVAAGSLADADGAGMTVLRLPGEDRLAEIARLATEDDASVRSGFFTVQVRPWNVMLQA